MFGFSYLKSVLQNLSGGIKRSIGKIFGNGSAQEEVLEKLERLLLESDLGSELTSSILFELKDKKNLSENIVWQAISQKFNSILSDKKLFIEPFPSVVMIVGVNGVGKTTFAAKFASLQKQKFENRVQLVAADTFRAAAGPQLEALAGQFGVSIFLPEKESDPASVIFDGCQGLVEGTVDGLIVDTAGRLHSKANLIKELQKCRSILARRIGQAKLDSNDKKVFQTWLVLDSTLGQANVEQAKIFFDAIDVDAIVLTKLDSAARGGSIIAVCHKFNRPIVWTSIGNQSGSVEPFDAKAFIDALLE